ncbi:hypothetical protein [Natrinema hispanicum]|uniref:hypothetical protein n=1 Tax=Natrinema hispanicum TaxID=392421 RepID=UPI00122D0F2D|nr:hypothetical protein [Natrinema hispanicum]
MVSAKQVGEAGIALTLSIGTGIFSLSVILNYGYGVAFLFSLGSSFGIAYFLCERYSTIDTEVLWKFGGLVIGLFAMGNVIVSNGIYASRGAGSPLVIGIIWIISLIVSYSVIVGDIIQSLRHNLAFW